MKQTDTKILTHLRSNARMNLTTLSRKTGIPVSTIFDRLRSHEGRLITKFTALLNFAALGYPVRMKVHLRVPAERRTDVRSYLVAHPRVNDVWRINNGWDYAADCVFRDIKEAEEFLEGLDLKFSVIDRQAFHVIDDIAREKALCEELVLD